MWREISETIELLRQKMSIQLVCFALVVYNLECPYVFLKVHTFLVALASQTSQFWNKSVSVLYIISIYIGIVSYL